MSLKTRTTALRQFLLKEKNNNYDNTKVASGSMVLGRDGIGGGMGVNMIKIQHMKFF